MLTINIQIDNKAFEDAVAKSITLSEGDDLSKEMTKIYLEDLKNRANSGVKTIAEEEIRGAIDAAFEQKKQEIIDVIEAAKPIEIIKEEIKL